MEKISQVSACAAKDLFITISGNVSYKALTCDDTIIKTDVGTVLIKHGNLCKYQIAPYIFQYLLPGWASWELWWFGQIASHGRSF